MDAKVISAIVYAIGWVVAASIYYFFAEEPQHSESLSLKAQASVAGFCWPLLAVALVVVGLCLPFIGWFKILDHLKASRKKNLKEVNK